MQLATGSSNPPPGPPLGGTNGDLRYRFLHFHVPLALVSIAVLFLWLSYPLFQSPGHQGTNHAMTQGGGHQGQHQGGSAPPTMEHSGHQTTNGDSTQTRRLVSTLTTATGYIALALLGLTLLIGPANLLLRRRNPVSNYLTRDVGIWAAIVSVIHVIAGFFVHGPPAALGERIRYYFLAPDGGPLTNTFGWANWTGLAATVIVVGLLAISSNFALRKLKARRWKNLQRLNYALFALVIAHAILYGALRSVTSVSTVLLSLIVSLAFVGQMMGIWLWRRRHSRPAATPL